MSHDASSLPTLSSRHHGDYKTTTKGATPVSSHCSRKGHRVPFTPSFYSMSVEAETRADCVFHNNSACRVAEGIATADRRASTGGHRLCAACEKLNSQESSKRW